MEWVGDYDFNDYLLIVTVKSDASCGDDSRKYRRRRV
jgi:hypothetical protein